MLLRLTTALIIAATQFIIIESVYVITRYDPSTSYYMQQINNNDYDSSQFLSSISSSSFDSFNAQKRSAQTLKSLPSHEHVCQTIIKTDFQPQFGHEQNGSRVEIQQDEQRKFRATFIECENVERSECHGIDNALFTSECVTLYEFRPAGVRIAGTTGDFVDGFVKVPITCQCRLRRKFNRLLVPDRP